MKVTAIMEKAKDGNFSMEKAKDGNFSCFVKEDFPGFGLAGYGSTAAEARTDMLLAWAEIREDMATKGLEVPELEFVYKYDMQSFFDCFPFLNVSKVAEPECLQGGRAGRHKPIADEAVYLGRGQCRAEAI